MTPWQRRLRLGFGIFVVALATLLGVSLCKSRRTAVVAPLPTKADPTAIVESTSGGLVRALGARQDLTIEHYDKLEGYADGRTRITGGRFKILKRGCRVEELQREIRERLEPALAFYMIIAWRVLVLAMLGRDCPEMLCDVVFATEEWRAVYLVTQRQPPPEEPPSLDTMVRMVAGLGGFLNRTADGFPGPQVLWIGLQRAADFVLALDAQRSIGTSCG